MLFLGMVQTTLLKETIVEKQRYQIWSNLKNETFIEGSQQPVLLFCFLNFILIMYRSYES